MKRFASLVLTAVLLAAMFTVFAMPAGAEDATSLEEESIVVEDDFAVLPDARLDRQAQGINFSSILSEGSLTIIVGVAAAVVFGLGGFFISRKKKKPAVAEGTENKENEE